MVRAQPRLHRELVAAARRAGVSLNNLVTITLERTLGEHSSADTSPPHDK
ncbi:toxin-antitoxin system HicB family antitoxin [Aurantimonas sp. A2-1-M11]